ncbi:hepatic lectin-like [Anomaloglossus baeobatrachus]|uniref:hepatic lectin-like n=1 Tax=Anomaloglossus baeobatrachus TaxID=238106 RepID=UPI003F508D4D
MSSYFKQRSVIITYGLLALSFILILVLFTTVHSHHFTSQKKHLAGKDDIFGVNITVNSLVEKLKNVEHVVKRKSSCDAGWQLFDGKCYFFSNTYSSWQKARSMCILKNADLAVINNANEQTFIMGITVNTHYWIGLTDTEEEGNWTWVDGTDYKSSYQNWSPYEPNSNGNEDCVHIWKQGKWNDNSCHYGYMFAICEKKL